MLLVALILGFNVLAVSSRLGFLHKPNQVKEYDHRRYIEMAKGNEGRTELQNEPPYCFRLAVPALVRGLSHLGLSVSAGFFLVTNAVLFGFLLVLWLHLRDLGFSLSLRVTGLLVVGLTQGAVRWFEYQYWMTDPAALFLVMLAFFLVERGRAGALLGVSVLAAFVRETYVLVYPYVFLRELRAGRPLLQAAGRTAALAALPFAILVAIRRLVTPNQPDDFVAGIVDSMAFRFNHLLDNQLYVVTLGAFGVLVPLVLLFPARLPGLARRHFDRALYVLSVVRHAGHFEQQRAAARLRAARPRARGTVVPAGLPRRDAAAGPARPGHGRGPPGRLLGQPALGRDRYEHLPAGQLDDGRGPGSSLARCPGRPVPPSTVDPPVVSSRATRPGCPNR